jgi:hypothetical protein
MHLLSAAEVFEDALTLLLPLHDQRVLAWESLLTKGGQS